MSDNNRHISTFHVPLKVLLTTLFVVAALVVFVVLAFSDSTTNEQAPVVSSERADWDSDGLSNKQEAELGTNPNSTDTDGDGFSDWEEVKTGHSPLISSIPKSNDEINIPEPAVQDAVIKVLWNKKLGPLLDYANWLEGRFVKDTSRGVVQMYMVGEVNDGPYAGFDVVLGIEETMGVSRYHYLAKKIPGSTGYEYAYQVVPVNDPPYDTRQFLVRASFADLEPFPTLPISKSSIVLKVDEYGLRNLVNAPEYDSKSLFFTHEGVSIFKAENGGCPFVERRDFTVSSYQYVLDFIREDGLIDLKFNDGLKNTAQYDYLNLTCGGGCKPYRFVDTSKVNPDKDFMKAGTTPKGFVFYQFKSNEHPVLKHYFDQYKGWYKDTEPTSLVYPDAQRAAGFTYQKFLDSRPMLFWKDPFDRWIEFHNKIYVPPAEMCKPVVYLYPEYETDVTVRVAPTGGMSVSDPVYPEGGWKMRAKPSGELFDLRDGKHYSSLFWEGQALHFETPKEGFVVERGELSKFFRWSLGAQGLNEKETAEFMSYWIPRMSEYPYYFVTFLSNESIHSYAPLFVEPVPTSVIRVFMSAHGLLAPHSVDPLEFETPKRTGFTVVEWGGTLQ